MKPRQRSALASAATAALPRVDAPLVGSTGERVLPTRTARSTRRGPIRPRRRDGAHWLTQADAWRQLARRERWISGCSVFCRLF